MMEIGYSAIPQVTLIVTAKVDFSVRRPATERFAAAGSGSVASVRFDARRDCPSACVAGERRCSIALHRTRCQILNGMKG
jgi:hypothetical protein